MKEYYPVGCRVGLDGADDTAVGVQGTVTGIEAENHLLVDWDNGDRDIVSIAHVHKISTEDEALATLNWYGAHQRQEDSRCPRCGDMMFGPTARHALSRYAQIYVCDRCGMEEALEKTGVTGAMPLTKWCAIKIPSIGGGAWRR